MFKIKWSIHNFGVMIGNFNPLVECVFPNGSIDGITENFVMNDGSVAKQSQLKHPVTIFVVQPGVGHHLKFSFSKRAGFVATQYFHVA